uniref:Retrotransposon gag domain-containing protein n=1 Tax=Lactuca sativa TaxID=4236 RepID=A0A9R1WVH0_LACSA|nr:hypothetical protein LSAT_V11C900490720 [Lactuca sativa]
MLHNISSIIFKPFPVSHNIGKPVLVLKFILAWMRCDIMVKRWLITTMEKEIRTSFKYANTTLKIWSDLRERFEMENAPRAYELKNQLINIHQDGISVFAYKPKFDPYGMRTSQFFPHLNALVIGVLVTSKND